MSLINELKRQARTRLGESQVRAIRQPLYSLLYGHDLPRLALAFGTDKQRGHSYATCYQRHFQPLRHERLNLLEIGIGGYDDPKSGGESLRMWKAYFPKAQIYGLDIHDKSWHDESRIKTFQGSQADGEVLRRVAAAIGSIDIIIDDGSHLNDHVIASFKMLFPLLSDRGLYVIEDVQTSYWDDFMGVRWGGSRDRAAPHTSMNFLKLLVDGLNHAEFLDASYVPSDFDQTITAIHFYHNIVFLQKGDNREPSNLVQGQAGSPQQ